MQLALEDSRRLTGPNLVSAGPGAVLEVRVEDGSPEPLVEAWKSRSRQVLDAVGWGDEKQYTRLHKTGISLAVSAPIDALYAATEVNEWALEAAVSDLNDEAPPEDIVAAVARLRAVIEEETNPRLLALRDEAARRGVMFLSDDDEVSVGMGIGSRTWPVADLPEPASVSWDRIHDIPLAMVTGTNGKTTTVRLLAAMARESDRVPGFSTTDGVFVGEELAEGGDFSGPGGARAVLRDRRVEVAILETARGGMLRRGLAVPRADAVLVSNVSLDHMGEYGLHDIDGMADAKLVISRAVSGGGTLVINADDAILVRRVRPGNATLVFTSRDGKPEVVHEHVASGGTALIGEDGWFTRAAGCVSEGLLPISDAPITMGGTAGYNVDNVLAALALAPSLGISDTAASKALLGFVPSPENLPGRANMFRLGSVTAIVDFAHNPHGIQALSEMVLLLPATRRLVIVGQAGDRDDESVRLLTRALASMNPDRIIIKELTKYLRGREPGEVPAIIRDELSEMRFDGEIGETDSEISAVREALEWCQGGELLVFPVQAERDEVTELLDRLVDSSWTPGSPLP